VVCDQTDQLEGAQVPEAIQLAVAWAIVIGTLGLVATAYTHARARLRASSPPPGQDAEVAELRTELRETVQRLSGDLADLQERVDFAERLLAKQRQPDRLPKES
jgi:hypothetical protein